MERLNRKIFGSSKKAPMESASILNPEYGHRKLVIIQLSGGNDGMNTIIPFENDLYYRLRPELGIRKNDALRLSSELGVHPAMEGFLNIYKAGLISILNNVGYPNPSRSHFRSLDIWHSASDPKVIDETGWIGRFLDHSIGENPLNKTLAIEINDVLSLAFKGDYHKGIVFENLKQLNSDLHTRIIKGIISRKIENKASVHPDLRFIYQTLNSGKDAVKSIFQQTKTQRLKTEFPDSSLGNQLRMVARMIAAETNTQIFQVTHGSFDTHAHQTGRHNALLEVLSEGLFSFVNCLQKENKLDDVCILVFSEFGRRISENGSKGTDHGAANNAFIISSALANPGLYNPVDDLSTLNDGDLIYSIDFRRIYASLLEDWLKVDSVPILNQSFEKLDLFKSGLFA